MKVRNAAAGACALLALAGCSESQLDYRNAEVSNGLIYAGSENKPFTGLVTNVPENFMRANNGYMDTLFNLNQTLKSLRSDRNMYMGRNFVCDAQVEKGFISGDVSCYQAKSRTLRYTAQYKDGNMDGALQIYAIDGQTRLAKAAFSQDLIDGKVEFWSPNTGKLVYLRTARNGKSDGVQENYDENSGQTTYKAKASNGQLIGTVERFSAQGKRVSEVPYDNGTPHGVAHEWDANTGNMTKLITFDHGVWTGEYQEWAADGSLTAHRVYARNVMMEDKLAPAQDAIADTDVDKCVAGLVEAFRAENGEEALIRHDQIAEWESDCGKAPWME